MKARWDWVGVRLQADVCGTKATQYSVVTLPRRNKWNDFISFLPRWDRGRAKPTRGCCFQTGDIVILWGGNKGFPFCMSHGQQQQQARKTPKQMSSRSFCVFLSFFHTRVISPELNMSQNWKHQTANFHWQPPQAGWVLLLVSTEVL